VTELAFLRDILSVAVLSSPKRRSTAATSIV